LKPTLRMDDTPPPLNFDGSPGRCTNLRVGWQVVPPRQHSAQQHSTNPEKRRHQPITHRLAANRGPHPPDLSCLCQLGGLFGAGWAWQGSRGTKPPLHPPPPEKIPVLRSIRCLSPLGGSPASRRGPVPNPVCPAFPAGTCGIISLFRWPRRRFLPLYRWTVAALFPTPERDLHAHGLRSAA